MTHTEGAGRRQSPAVPGLPLDDYEDDLDAYAKEVVDALPPLTSDQRDLLALIFRQQRRLNHQRRGELPPGQMPTGLSSLVPSEPSWFRARLKACLLRADPAGGPAVDGVRTPGHRSQGAPWGRAVRNASNPCRNRRWRDRSPGPAGGRGVRVRKGLGV